MASPTKRASRATYRPTGWLLQDYIPLGALTILDGDPGAFKSTLMVDLAARVSKGQRMPLNLGSSLTSPARVLIYEAEDTESHMTSMLTVAGADMDMVRVAYKSTKGPPLLLPDDMPHLERLTSVAQPKLIIIDPVTESVRGGLNNGTAVYRALGPLAALAERLQAAVVLLRHLSKVHSGDARRAGMGSTALTAIARSVILLAPDPANAANRALAVAKPSWAATPSTALLFCPLKEGDCTRLFWLGDVPLRANDLLEGADDAMDEAKAFLRTYLANGERRTNDMTAAAKAAGVAHRTLVRARKSLRVVSRHEEIDGNMIYFVSLPPDPYAAAVALEIQRAEAEQQRLTFLDSHIKPKKRWIDQLPQPVSPDAPDSGDSPTAAKKKRLISPCPPDSPTEPPPSSA